MWQKLWEGAENLTKTKPREENDTTLKLGNGSIASKSLLGGMKPGPRLKVSDEWVESTLPSPSPRARQRSSQPNSCFSLIFTNLNR